MRREPDTPQGTIALLAVYLLIIIFLWSNVYFTMRSRGVNTSTGSIMSQPSIVQMLDSFSSGADESSSLMRGSQI